MSSKYVLLSFFFSEMGLFDNSFLDMYLKLFIVNFDGSILLPTLLTLYFIYSVIFNQMGI
jgi:hypothetical protein